MMLKNPPLLSISLDIHTIPVIDKMMDYLDQ